MTFPKITRMKNSMHLGSATALPASISFMGLTPSERAAGRIMRAPDGHGVPTDDAPSAPAVPAGDVADGGGDQSTTGDAPAPEGDAPTSDGDAPAGEEKPLTAEEQAAKDAADKEAADKAADEFQPHGAPEGDYAIEMPEGVELDKTMLDAFVPVAKELDLSNAGAQKLTAFFIEKVQPQIAEAFVKGIEADVENQKAQFAADAKALVETDAKAEKPEDRVFAGKNFDAVVKTTARTLDRFGTPELRDFLNVSGLGNHPELVKMMYKIGDKIGEDNDFTRGGHVPQPKTREEKYYGTS
jgi:hypothetical protein